MPVNRVRKDKHVEESLTIKPQLYILAGFLGAGKTTLLNNFLTLLDGHKVGILINEFGTVGIDSTRAQTKNKNPVIELNNGQIFCSCLAGSFVDAIVTLIKRQPEYILVESSGLAKPAPLMKIINEIKERTNDAFVYRGMIAVIDVQTYPVLSQTVNALNEQLKYSDVFLLNKTDLVDTETTAAVRLELEQIKPQAKIWETAFCRIEPSMLNLTPTTPSATIGPLPPNGQNQILKLTLWQEKSLTKQALTDFLRQVTPVVQRIKGTLQLKNEVVEVNTVGKIIKIEPVNLKLAHGEINYCLSALSDKNGEQAPLVLQAWQKAQV